MLRENVTWLAIGAHLTTALMLTAARWPAALATVHGAAHLLANRLELLRILGLAPASHGSDGILMLHLSVAFLNLVRMVGACSIG